MLKAIIKKKVIVLGPDASVKNFKKKYPGFDYIDIDDVKDTSDNDTAVKDIDETETVEAAKEEAAETEAAAETAETEAAETETAEASEVEAAETETAEAEAVETETVEAAEEEAAETEAAAETAETEAAETETAEASEAEAAETETTEAEAVETETVEAAETEAAAETAETDAAEAEAVETEAAEAEIAAAETEDKVDPADCCYIVVGRAWKNVTAKLEAKGHVFWSDIFPDWIDILLEDGKFIYFEKLKKYCKKDPAAMGDVLEYLSRYKKIAAVYANCQSTYISIMLQNVSSFTDDYILCRFLPLQIMFAEMKTGFSKEYMSKFSLFIYQNVGRENDYSENLSTYNILPMLSKSCIKIAIPYAYFNGYFPQYIKNVRNDEVKQGEGHVPYGDTKIQKFLEDGLTIEETVDKLGAADLFSEEEIMRNLYNTFYELEKREKKCDIIISDFIKKNYQKKYLFYAPSHPTNITQAVIVKRILDKLGYKYHEANFKGLPENDMYQVYIYPCVRKKLGLTFKKERFWLCKEGLWSGNDKNNPHGKELTIKEYVVEYARYCFPELNENSRQNFRTIKITHLLSLNPEMVTERKFSIMEMFGDCVHLALYLTAEVDSPKGYLFHVHPNYAPATSYIFPAHIVGRNGGVFPMTIHINGECYTEMPQVLKGNVIIIDTTWFMRPKNNVFQMEEEN